MLNTAKIGERIKEARKNAGMLQEELGKVVEASQTVVSDLEKGRRQTIGIDTLNSIATATNTPVHVLLGFDVRTLAMEAIREQAPELAAQIEKEGLASLTDERCRAIVRIVLE